MSAANSTCLLYDVSADCGIRYLLIKRFAYHRGNTMTNAGDVGPKHWLQQNLVCLFVCLFLVLVESLKLRQRAYLVPNEHVTVIGLGM